MDFVSDFKDTGNCEIIEKNVLADWRRIPHLWSISQWRDTYRLIKDVRKNTENCSLKVGISTKTAEKLIRELGLTQIESPMFRSGSTWRLDV